MNGDDGDHKDDAAQSPALLRSRGPLFVYVMNTPERLLYTGVSSNPYLRVRSHNREHGYPPGARCVRRGSPHWSIAFIVGPFEYGARSYHRDLTYALQRYCENRPVPQRPFQFVRSRSYGTGPFSSASATTRRFKRRPRPSSSTRPLESPPPGQEYASLDRACDPSKRQCLVVWAEPAANHLTEPVFGFRVTAPPSDAQSHGHSSNVSSEEE